MLGPLSAILAQEPDTSVTRSQQKSSEELPDFLKEFVKKYEKQVQVDSVGDLKANGLTPETLLNNLVIDNTLSKIGRDFYQFFYDNWDPPQTDQQFIIYIDEMPSPGMGNMVMIRINHDKIYTGRLFPKQEALEATAMQAVQQTLSYVANYDEIRKQLEGEDMQGTGIY
jgi:curli production assembly/transport component CsgE